MNTMPLQNVVICVVYLSAILYFIHLHVFEHDVKKLWSCTRVHVCIENMCCGLC